MLPTRQLVPDSNKSLTSDNREHGGSRSSGYMGGIIYTLVIGLVIGAIAKLLMPGKDPGGCIITMIIGLIGSLLGGFLGKLLGLYEAHEPAGFIGSVIGAMLLLFIYRMVMGKKA